MQLRWCECDHTDESHPGGGPCNGEDPHGRPCPCAWFEEAPSSEIAHLD